jgi:paraquat-inducible protein A
MTAASTSINTQKIICHECDLLIVFTTLEYGHSANCPRCGFVLTRKFTNAKSRIMATACAGLIFLLFALLLPFLSLDAFGFGFERSVTLIESIQTVVATDFASIALFIVLSAMVIPCVFLLGVIYVLLSLRLTTLLPYTHNTLKFLFVLLPWSMAEIFLIGVLVSLVKIASLASITLGASFWFYTAFIICLVATVSLLDKYQAWEWIKQHAK